MVVATFALAATAHTQQNVPEPDGYRTDNYRAPVPATLAGVRVLTTAEAETIWREGTGAFIDVLPRAPKPQNLPSGTVWRDSGGNNAALLVIYCQENCWMSWNAAKRVLSYGYPNVAWYPEGTEG